MEKKYHSSRQFFWLLNNTTNPFATKYFQQKIQFILRFSELSQNRKTNQNAAKDLNYKKFDTNISDLSTPRLPPIHKLSCLTSKGCGIFYQTLRAKELARRSTAESETKWQDKLGTLFSINFWDKIWKLNKSPLVIESKYSRSESWSLHGVTPVR